VRRSIFIEKLVSPEFRSTDKGLRGVASQSVGVNFIPKLQGVPESEFYTLDDTNLM
jgi:hypothetical protein